MSPTSPSELLSLGYKYEKGIRVEKDEHKAFFYYQKSADMGDAIAMRNLGNCYYEGIGVEKDEHKAFIYYQKSADMGDEIGINNLGVCYQNGIGVEKNEHKAFIYYQKSADMGGALGTNNVGYCYQNGIGVEKNEHKAFIYCQKSADMGDATAVNNLGVCYRQGIGVEKDEHKAFIYFQKSADMGNAQATCNVGCFYRDGTRVEKDEKKAFEYFKKAADMGDDNGTFNVGFCYLNQIGVQMDENKVFEYFKKSADMGFNLGRLFVGDCYRNGIGVSRDIHRANHWYRMGRNLLKSNNLLPENIDYKLKKLLSNEKYKLTWVSYNEFKNIRKIGNGGFSTVYYAYWNNKIRGLWTHVAVKLIHGSNEHAQEFINELERYCEIGSENPSFLECYGISRDEESKDYMIVLSYAREGYLRKNLQKVAQMKWMDKLNLLHCIASDLESIHSHELVHCDLHSGNILQHNLRSAYITDLGLSSEKEKDGKVRGVLPYVAPEVLLSGKFTQAADIYGLGIIMTEYQQEKGLLTKNHLMKNFQCRYTEEKGQNLILKLLIVMLNWQKGVWKRILTNVPPLTRSIITSVTG